MKNVWILEKWVTVDGLMDQRADLQKWMAEEDQRADLKETCQKVIEAIDKKMAECPDGYWCGWEGKTIYRQFCSVAKECLRRYDGKPDRFRVVKAQIEDDAKEWCDYVNPVENEGVLRYLYATK